MATARVGRNDVCACGSGKKFKKCCEAKASRSRGSLLMVVLISVLVLAGVAAAVSNFSKDAAHTVKTSGVWDPEHGHYH
jgi:ABC-type Na+ efflux pump permease subunit